jgi:hypothetical protein
MREPRLDRQPADIRADRILVAGLVLARQHGAIRDLGDHGCQQ